MRKFAKTHNPALLVNLNNSFVDESDNELHLTGTSPVFRQCWPGAIGLASGTATRVAGSIAPLLLHGDKTFEAIVVMRAVPTNGAIALVSGVGGSELEIDNAIWQVNLSNQNSVAVFSEHGAGVDDGTSASVAGQGLPALGVPFHLAVRWKGASRTVLVDGSVFSESVEDPDPPTGGANARFLLRSGGTNPPEVLALKLTPSALSFAEILASRNHAVGDDFGDIVERVESLWAGALTDDGITIVAKLTHDSDSVRIGVAGSSGVIYSAGGGTADTRAAKFSITGLDPDTEYTYWVESNGIVIEGETGRFRTLPTAGQPASFTVAFSGDAWNDSNHVVFDTIRQSTPLMFWHLGDAHYANIATNSPVAFRAAFDQMLALTRYGHLLRDTPSAYVWDDHDYGPNNSDASSASRPAATSVYRERVPHYPLPDSNGAIYHSFDIGRVRVIVTDQRSEASANSAMDTASKTMLGAAQKTWFKDLLSNSPGMFIVWVCPRMFVGPTTAGADHWGGFSTERAELVSHIHTECPGRAAVLSADIHELGIGYFDFLPGGGEPVPVFQAAPLSVAPGASGVVYSEVASTLNIGQFGTMEIEDSGGISIDVTWRAFDSAGALLGTHTFLVVL